MKKYYAFAGKMPLGKEYAGSENRILFELKTNEGAKKRAVESLKTSSYSLYSYTDFYDYSTFTKIA